jgi:hypothetical protein
VRAAKQKTFVYCWRWRALARARRSKSFFASFFSKKEALTLLLSFATDGPELGCFVGFASSQ